jgi:hypothetical protein
MLLPGGLSLLNLDLIHVQPAHRETAGIATPFGHAPWGLQRQQAELNVLQRPLAVRPVGRVAGR